MYLWLAEIAYCFSEEEYDFVSNNDLESRNLLLGVFSTRDRAKSVLNAVIPDLKWHEEDYEDHSEWLDDKQYYFKNQNGTEYYVTFVSVQRIELDESDAWVGYIITGYVK